ncbi:GMC oxidoreductase [Pseudarthrobacter sp. LMD1-1-1.1]|uniref:GMC oxidoreductase n=1 Tax=Pseudarthrobacter sp. LMD1-1-1.1 TaxID=3135242 RepID=UPI00342C183B
MGAAIAQQVRSSRPRARIVMVDGGRRIGATPGQHLHDVTDPALRSRYVKQASPGIQSAYVGADVSHRIDNGTEGMEPGLYNVAALSGNSTAFPGAAVGMNQGGMGVHWTAACPWPWGDESFAAEDSDAWAEDLHTAQRLLGVHPNPYGTSLPGQKLLEKITGVVGKSCAASRQPQPMPMAITPDGDRLLRTGPNRILPRMTEPAGEDFELLTETLALELVHDSDTVSGVRVKDISTGSERIIKATTVAVAADPLRTPQLLFASGIRPPALGRYLNEHAFLTGQVVADLGRLGLTLSDIPSLRADEWVLGCYWLPHDGSKQPFHGQVMDRTFFAPDGSPLAYGVVLGFFIPTDINASNRIDFSESFLDSTGMPEMAFTFGYSDADKARIEHAKRVQRALAEAIGVADLESWESELLPAGSSLHFTGTTRAGATNDGTSVCNLEGKVWGYSNLYLAGGSVVPTALVGNSTLTATITAVRAARAITARLSDLEHNQGKALALQGEAQ